MAKLYLKKGEVDDAARVLGGIIEQLLAGREENDLLALLHEGWLSSPEHIEALRLLIRVYWWQRDMDQPAPGSGTPGRRCRSCWVG